MSNETIVILNQSQQGRSFMTSLGKLIPGKTLEFPIDSKELKTLLTMPDIADASKIVPIVHDRMEALKSENAALRKRVNELESQAPASVLKAESKEAIPEYPKEEVLSETKKKTGRRGK